MKMMEEGFNMIFNLSASPFDYIHASDRLEVIRANVNKYKVPLFYVNNYRAQTEIIFDGGSVVMSPDGSIYELPYLKEHWKYMI